MLITDIVSFERPSHGLYRSQIFNALLMDRFSFFFCCCCYRLGCYLQKRVSVANRKGSDQTAYLCSLIRASAVGSHYEKPTDCTNSQTSLSIFFRVKQPFGML